MPEVTRRSFIAASAAAGTALSAAADEPAEPWRPQTLDAPVPLDALPTPALIVDIDQVEANLRAMAEFMKARGAGIRPHVKTHKCPHLAHRQMALGALGICCAKVSEAEVMAAAGIERILITSPVATKDKVDRVVALAKASPGLQMVVDRPQNADDFSAAAGAAGLTLGVLIDLESGTGRTGIAMGDPALDLAHHIAGLKHLRLDGLQCYCGHLMHVADYASRRTHSHEVLSRALETKALIEQAGIPLGIVTGGGTGTYDIDSEVKGITDIQCGSYCVMDVQYGMVGTAQGRLFDAFPPAMFVWSTAISQPLPDRITIDAGLKAIYRDTPRAELRGISGATYDFGGDEHGILRFDNPSRPIRVGDKVAVIPSHCDPTINLYDCFHACRNGHIVERWPISARGKSE